MADDDAPPGVPEWVVTYGDMMSLLLTFFIMLVSMSEVVAADKYRAILESLERYLGYQTGPISPPGHHFPMNSLMLALETLGSSTNLEAGTGGVRREGPPGRELRVFHTREGDAIPMGRPIGFRPGEVSLSNEAKSELERIAADLAGKPHKIEVRAHTSADPPPASAPANDLTTLSYLRAREVQRFLKAQGVALARMRLTAAGATEPPRKSPDEGLVSADRVEVLILDEYARSFIGPAETSE